MKDDINSSHLVTLSLKFQWRTEVNEDTFHVDSSSNNTHFLKFYGWKVKSARNGKRWRLSRRFQTLIWRLGGTVQNLESPGLSRRVDRTAIRWPAGQLPYVSHIVPFQSENELRLLPFWTEIGYGFRGNCRSEWTYLSFLFKMNMKERVICKFKMHFTKSLCWCSNLSILMMT